MKTYKLELTGVETLVILQALRLMHENRTVNLLDKKKSEELRLKLKEQIKDSNENGEPVQHGEWIVAVKGAYAELLECPKCGCYSSKYYGNVRKPKFCWNCGARMSSESERTEK